MYLGGLSNLSVAADVVVVAAGSIRWEVGVGSVEDQ